MGLVMVAALAGAGCRSAALRPGSERTGNASFEVLDDAPLSPAPPPSHSTEMQVAGEEIVYIPAELHAPQARPVYPPVALAGKGGTFVLYLTATFDETGRLVDLQRSFGRVSLPHPHEEAFFAAARTAIEQWKVEPAREVYWRVPADGGERQYQRTEVVSTTVEIKFTFDESGEVR